MPIGNYGGSDPNEALRKEFTMSEQAKKKAKRAREVLTHELLKHGATLEQLEQAVAVTTDVENVGGMPAGITMGLPAVDAAMHLEVGEVHLAAKPHQAPEFMLRFAGKLEAPKLEAPEVAEVDAMPPQLSPLPAPLPTPSARPERSKSK